MSRGHRLSLRSFSAAGLALLAIAAVGCQSEAPHRSARLSKNYDGRFANTISYESFGTTAAVDCADGKSLDVAGSNNTLTVRGRCEAVSVMGADNRITVEHIAKKLTLTGFHNSVTYRGGDPTVDDRGSSNTVVDKR